MRAVTGVRIHGMDDLQETLNGILPREARNILRRTTVKIAAGVRDQVRAKAPVDTGNLKRSIKSRRADDKGQINKVAAQVIADKSGGRSGSGYHWHLLEFGTVKMPARPFLLPAVEGMRPRIPAIYREEFGVQLERELAKRAKRRK